MAKNVMRVNGRHGESMSLEDGTVRFRSQNVTHQMKADEFRRFDIVSVEEAREAIEGTEEVAGAWCDQTPATKGKSLLLLGSGRGFCWVMEITKNQGSNAIAFARNVCPAQSEEEEELEYKLYAAIQTPKGALFTVGSIACAFGAYYAVGVAQQPIVALILAGLCIFMFVNVK